MKIKDVCAVVTGAASGLGAATARMFAEAGAQVTCFDRDAGTGATLAGEIGAGFVPVDVTDEGSVRGGVAAALASMGHITCLVNCAGIAIAEKTLGREGPHGLDSFRKTVDVNLTGSFNCMRLVSEAMAKNDPGANGQRGVIVHTASIAAFDGQKGQAAYAASKGGVASMTLPAARDLAGTGIRVNAIAPGVFLTPMLEGLDASVQEALAAEVLFPKRLGDPAEFAGLVRFIVECDYLNGEVIRLDGALRMT